MTILQDRPTAEMEEAVQNGFDLSWLQQLKQQIPGAAEELANDPTLAEHTPELLNESPNQTQRTRGAIPATACRSIPPTRSATRRKCGDTT